MQPSGGFTDRTLYCDVSDASAFLPAEEWQNSSYTFSCPFTHLSRQASCAGEDNMNNVSDEPADCSGTLPVHSKKKKNDVLTCFVCSYRWVPKNDTLPMKCPKCRSTKWNQEYARLTTCRRCGYQWRPRSSNPAKCPSCQSGKWRSDPRHLICRRCGHEWILRSENIPKKCPSCKSQKWNKAVRTEICSRCGHIKEIRSNSRHGMCPICDASVQAHVCMRCGHKWISSRGRCPMECPSCKTADWAE